ncbi:MAG: sugar phosphate isomerase/epimerase [Bryobacteraceae bacterium]
MVTRREWAASVAGAAGALSLARPLSAQDYKIERADIKLGVASYSFRKFSRAQAIQMTKELGTPYINIKSFHLPLDSTPEQIDQARKEFEDAGLIIVGGGTISLPKYDETQIRQAFEYGKRAGMPLLVVMPARDVLPKLGKFVEEYNIKIAVHNHGPEDKNFPTPQSALAIVKDMDPRCGLCIDVGHTARTGVDVVESIAEAGPRLLDMHVKDLKDFHAKDSQCDCGDGKMPFPAMFQQLVKMGYRGCSNLEYEIKENDPMPGMQRSMSYMRGVLAGVTYFDTKA